MPNSDKLEEFLQGIQSQLNDVRRCVLGHPDRLAHQATPLFVGSVADNIGQEEDPFVSGSRSHKPWLDEFHLRMDAVEKSFETLPRFLQQSSLPTYDPYLSMEGYISTPPPCHFSAVEFEGDFLARDYETIQFCPDSSPSPLTHGSSDLTQVQQDAQLGQPSFYLSRQDMGLQLTSNLSKFNKDPSFRGCIKTEIPDINWATLIQRMPDTLLSSGLQKAVQYKQDSGMCTLVQVAAKFDKAIPIPNASELVLPTTDAAEEFLNTMAEKPPAGKLSYYVGPPLTADFFGVLHPGDNMLSNFALMDGINSEYIHFGDQYSGTAFHREDAGFRSVNQILGGIKIVVIIDAASTTLFEYQIKRIWTCGDCDQAIRHLHLFLPPQVLRQWGVGFSIHCLGPGDMFTTKPFQYHLVINYTASFAHSINFLLSEDPLMPNPVVKVCKMDGIYHMPGVEHVDIPPPDAGIRRRPKTPLSSLPAASYWPSPEKDQSMDECSVAEKESLQGARKFRTKRRAVAHTEDGGDTDTEIAEEKRCKRLQTRTDTQKERQEQGARKNRAALINLIKQNALRIDPLCNLKIFNMDNNEASIDPAIYTMAVALHSRIAVEQICNLVYAHRMQRQTHPHLSDLRAGPQSDDAAVIGETMRWIEGLSGKMSLFKLQICMGQIIIFRRFESMRRGRRRTPTEDLRKLSRLLQLDERKLREHRRLGEKWNRLDAAVGGILCLLPLDKRKDFQVTRHQYADLNNDELRGFTYLLNNEYAQRLRFTSARVQEALHGSLLQNSMFRWERLEDRKFLTDCDEGVLLDLLQPIMHIDENVVSKSLANDPTAIPREDKQCDYCSEAKCQCPSSTLSQTAIRRNHDGILCVEAALLIGKDKEPIFKAGDYIGMLTGELVDASYECSDRLDLAVDLVQLDMAGDTGAACKIRVTERGNHLMLLRHSDTPCAKVLTKRRRGRWVLAVEAVSDIVAGEAITVGAGTRLPVSNSTHLPNSEKTTPSQPPSARIHTSNSP